MRKKVLNECVLRFKAVSHNEAVSRSAAAAFALSLEPTAEEVAAIKLAVSEAVTNAVVHAYPEGGGIVEMFLRSYEGGVIKITVTDKGCGIADVEKARQPQFSTAPPEAERSGLGFTVMESFMDRVSVRSAVGRGVSVTLEKRIGGR